MKTFLIAIALTLAAFEPCRAQVTPQQFQADAQAFVDAYGQVAASQAAVANAQAVLAASQSALMTASAAELSAYQTVAADLAALNPGGGTVGKLGDAPHGDWPHPHPYYPGYNPGFFPPTYFPTPQYIPTPQYVPTPQPLPAAPAGYQYQLGADNAFHLVPIIAAHAAPMEKIAAPVIPPGLLASLFPNGFPIPFNGFNQQSNGMAIYPGSQTPSNPAGTPVPVHYPGNWIGVPPGPYTWQVTR